jgi:hypothetical protein
MFHMCLTNAQTTGIITVQHAFLFKNNWFHFGPTKVSNFAHHGVPLLPNNACHYCSTAGPIVAQQLAFRISMNTEIHTTVNLIYTR